MRRDRGYIALVDTGTDSTVLPVSIAGYLGIELRDEDIPPATAFGGQRVKLLSGDVTMRLVADDEELIWTTSVGFFDFPAAEEEASLLGHAGFLDYFTAIFDGKLGELTLLPNDELPPVA